MAKNMKEDPDFIGAWVESEKSLTLEAIIKLFDIDPERFYFYELEKDGAAEDAIDLMETIVSTGVIDMLVVNSLKCLVPKKEFNDSMSDQNVAIQARMNAKLQRKFTTVVGDSNCAFVMITHLSTDIGSMSRDPLIITGGKAIVYWSSMTLDLRKRSILEGDPVTRDDHMKIGVTIKKNHCSVSKNPYVKCEYFVEYGVGILTDLEIIEAAINQGILVKAGAFIKEPDENGEPKILPDGTKMQWQGMAKLKSYINENPDYLTYLQTSISSIGTVETMTEEEIEEAQEDEKAIKKAMKKELEEEKKTNKKEKEIKKTIKKDDVDNELEKVMDKQ